MGFPPTNNSNTAPLHQSLTFVQHQSPPSLLDVLNELKMARATQRSFSSEIIEKRGDFSPPKKLAERSWLSFLFRCGGGRRQIWGTETLAVARGS
jgi:hypothetical protein